MWEARTGRAIATLQAHTGAVSGVALSNGRDGQLLASAGGDGTVRLWEASSARPQATLQGQTGGVWSVALSASGRLVASGGTDGQVRLWDTSTGRAGGTLQGHVGAVFGVALSADGGLLASGSGDGTVGRGTPGPAQWRSSTHTRAVGASHYLLMARCWPAAVQMGWSDGETSTADRWQPLHGHAGQFGVALSADGQLASGGAMGPRGRVESARANYWPGSGPRPVRDVALSMTAGYCVVVPKGRCGCGRSAPVKRWQPLHGRGLERRPIRDGLLMVSGGTDGIVGCGTPARNPIVGHNPGVWSVALVPTVVAARAALTGR